MLQSIETIINLILYNIFYTSKNKPAKEAKMEVKKYYDFIQ